MTNKQIGILIAIPFIIAILLILKPFKIIDAGERGVVLKLGAVDRVMDEGFNWKIPFVEKVKVLDVRTQKIEVSATGASKDLQTVDSTIALNFNLIPENVGLLWQEIGREYQSRIIDPAIQEAVKSATAQFNAEALITQRPKVKELIKESLINTLRSQHILVTNISIVDFSFSESFDIAIEAKVTAEQKALEQENKLKQVEFEALQKIEQAKAEAESVRLRANALKENPRFLELKKLEVEMKRAEKWDGKLPVNIYGSAPIPFLNVGN